MHCEALRRRDSEALRVRASRAFLLTAMGLACGLLAALVFMGVAVVDREHERRGYYAAEAKP